MWKTHCKASKLQSKYLIMCSTWKWLQPFFFAWRSEKDSTSVIKKTTYSRERKRISHLLWLKNWNYYNQLTKMYNDLKTLQVYFYDVDPLSSVVSYIYNLGHHGLIQKVSQNTK